MKTLEIKKEIEKKGGLKSFSSSIRRNRNVSRPMRHNIINELQELTDEELNIAFHLSLIGNNNRKGSVVENICKY